ncbi:UDP-Glc:alpha-D-GlcNAc-diphosphoundecaprenol beta-1,3-glucosyltransferase WfgD [compost metagenome]
MGQNIEKKVSIIIPNYNRASLIGETLDSIIGQTYSHWECLIIDDQSSDNSAAVIKRYITQDSRFKLFQRPPAHPKGANACRNIGMQKASGDYIIFFDSDDLMVENHIEKKITAIQSENYDYVIAKSKYFNNPENKNPLNYRDLGKIPITADNYIKKKINWITFDPIIKTSIAKSISFTEKNKSAEEYNYFVKLVLTTNNATAIDEILTKRRFHEGSYQVNLKTKVEIAENQFYYFYDTFLDVRNMNISKSSLQFLLLESCKILYRQKDLLTSSEKKEFYKHLIKTFGFFKGINKIRLLL